ncbi:MAG: MetQ/NlpA family ABC transporter substrate-binding protein [Clostridiales bacterium]|nr:MetQ/NlpA family ABC transporter substrate-binding protein [Clostridiales bacterium]
MKKSWIAISLLIAAMGLTACGGSSSTAATTAAVATEAAESETEEIAGDTEAAKADTGNSAESASDGKTEIIYGKSQGPYTELFEAAIIPILEEQGYTLKGIDFSDLQTADVGLNDGDVDVNVEQHTAYCENFNANYNGDLVPISPIPTVPAGVYSVNHETLDEIPDGAKVAVPNDASNTARCYLMLQKIGWITLDENADSTAVTQDDIVENPHNIEFTEMKSLTIPAAIQDFDYVAITGSVVYNAGIDASTALANEDIQDHLVLQVVVKEENKDAAWAKAIVDAYHSDEFKQYMKENNDGLWWVPEELQ